MGAPASVYPTLTLRASLLGAHFGRAQVMNPSRASPASQGEEQARRPVFARGAERPGAGPTLKLVMRDRLLPAALLGVATAAALASGAEPEEPDFHATPEVVQGSNKVELGIGDSLAFTLAHAAPGDVIELKKGCHPAPKGLAFDRSGRPDAWIVLRGNKDDRPVIDVAGGEFHIGGSY